MISVELLHQHVGNMKLKELQFTDLFERGSNERDGVVTPRQNH
jgi:hypothetical protein